MVGVLVLVLLLATTAALPTPQMCSKFAKFVARWNPIPETLLDWSKDNCDKIQSRPSEMTCSDIQRFIADCNYGGGGPVGGGQELTPAAHESLEGHYQRVYGNYPQVLPRYIHYNKATVTDFGQFGNWYYPNYYPPTYLGYYDGRPESIAQLENDYRFAKGGHYLYNRADNIVNIGLQQTYLPTCLHDVFYCVRAANPSPYQHYYAERHAPLRKSRAQSHNSDDENHEY